MTQPTLEERVAALEKLVVQILAKLPPPEPARDWRATVGMFANDPVMKEIDEAGRQIREADRRRTKRERNGPDRKDEEGKRRRARK
jgi:hypothetical protein